MFPIFTKTYIKDLPWIELAVHCICRHVQEAAEWHIVIEDEHLQQLEGAIRAGTSRNGPGLVTFKLHPLGEHWQDWRSFPDGYMRQQWVKMTAHRVMGDGLFWHWDSDLMAVKPFTSANFMSCGRAIYWFTQFNSMVDKANPMAGVERRKMLMEIFRASEMSFEFMRCLPIPCHGAISRNFEKRPEWLRCIEAMRAPDRRFSEFNILGHFSHQFYPDAYEWRNTQNYPHTWGGAPNDAHAIVSQSWSWAGVPEELKAYVLSL